MYNSDYGSAYDGYLAEFNAYAGGVYNELTESTLTNAMKYSFFAGGKRVRPVIMMACAEKLGGNIKKILPFAFALECIHTYSLVHDDLPAIDNDVLRRGKPTCHIAYGEAAAVLAGDGLLNFAFEHLLGNVTSKREIEATKIIAEYSGYDGMLGGQAADVENEKRTDCGIDELNDIYDKNGRIAEKMNPKAKRRVISEEASRILARYLEGVVRDGSGKQAYVAGYKVGGKTGTAQKFENGVLSVGKNVMSFVGFFPANNPKYLALAIVDEPDGGRYGSTVAAPLVKKVFEGIIETKNIKAFEKVENEN